MHPSAFPNLTIQPQPNPHLTLNPIIKHIREHIEDEDGDARKVYSLNLSNFMLDKYREL